MFRPVRLMIVRDTSNSNLGSRVQIPLGHPSVGSLTVKRENLSDACYTHGLAIVRVTSILADEFLVRIQTC
jgi:hypothetical protein